MKRVVALFAIAGLLFVMWPVWSESNGGYHIEVFGDGGWQQSGYLDFDQYHRTKTLAISPLHGEKEIRIRLLQEGGGAAHIDSVLLDNHPPATAGEGVNIKKISHADYDIIEAYGNKTELIFERSPGASGGQSLLPLTLELTARVEANYISPVPFQYPLSNTYRRMNENSRFYLYELDTVAGSLTLDGELTPENLGKPFFSENFTVGSGHPQAEAYGWVMNDKDNLYVAIDLTADNTMDGGKDYAKVYVNTASGLREFISTTVQREWGIPGYTYTERVPYQHKTYEFSIPLTEIVPAVAPESPPPLQIAFAAYGTISPLRPDGASLVYDTVSNEFFVSYDITDGEGGSDIMARRLDPDGTAPGEPVMLEASAAADSFSLTLDAALDPTSGNYLTVWWASGNDNDIFGRIINRDESFASDVFNVSAGSDDEIFPAVAADTINSRFLVVWEGDGGTQGIYAQLVNALDGDLLTAGALTGGADPSDYIMIRDPGWHSNPHVTFDSVNGQYLVVWEDGYPSPKIYGRLVNSDGTLVGENEFLISSDTDDARNPSAAFNPDDEEFLVTWENIVDGAIHGQRISAAGVAQGGDLAFSSGNADNYPEVSFDPISNGYIVVWHSYIDIPNEEDVIARYVTGAGIMPEASYTLADTPDTRQLYPKPAYNTYDGNLLVSFITDASEDYIIKKLGDNTADPGLAWVAGETNGVDPDSGPSGTTFTFKVQYVSASNLEPQTAELWLDLDGDGSYSASVTPISPFVGGAKPPATTGLLIGLIGLLSLALFYFFRTQRVRRFLAPIAFILITAGISLGLLMGCPDPGVGVDYTIQSADFPETGTAGGALSGTLKVQNVGDSKGLSTYDWFVYLSGETTAVQSDPKADEGSAAPLAAGASSADIDYSGTWPSDPGTYYLIAAVEASDDSNAANNQYASNAYIIGAASEIKQMEEDDPADLDYTDGKIYSLDVVIDGDARTIPYRFVFSDGTNTAENYGATEMELEITP